MELLCLEYLKINLKLFVSSQVFPSVAAEDEDDVKSIRSDRMKMETSGNSLEEMMEECRVEEMSVSKVRLTDAFCLVKLHF